MKIQTKLTQHPPPPKKRKQNKLKKHTSQKILLEPVISEILIS